VRRWVNGRRIVGVSIRVRFEGGPADGVVRDYPAFSTALPSLYWSQDDPYVAGIYRRCVNDEPVDAVWCYRYVAQDPPSSP
jgi:hypothetical protein